MKSPIKWAGGKGKLIEVIKSVLPPPSECQRLIEPFVGGANVFLNTEYKEYILGDANRDLVWLYEVIREFPEWLITRLREMWSDHSEGMYYHVRSEFNKLGDNKILDQYRSRHEFYKVGREKSAYFIYLNRHAFNGLCRYNTRGEFNAPWGKYENPYLPIEEIEQMAQKLSQHETYLLCDDFENIMRSVDPGDAIYCDPPYVPLSATSTFTSYAPGGFDMPDQIRLAGLAEELSNKGVHVAISNHDLPVTRELYRNADQIVEVNVQRNISCKGDSREKVKELIAVYLPK